MHGFRSIIEVTEKLKQYCVNFPGGGAFEKFFGPVNPGEFEQKLSKN